MLYSTSSSGKQPIRTENRQMTLMGFKPTTFRSAARRINHYPIAGGGGWGCGSSPPPLSSLTAATAAWSSSKRVCCRGLFDVSVPVVSFQFRPLSDWVVRETGGTILQRSFSSLLFGMSRDVHSLTFSIYACCTRALHLFIYSVSSAGPDNESTTLRPKGSIRYQTKSYD